MLITLPALLCSLICRFDYLHRLVECVTGGLHLKPERPCDSELLTEERLMALAGVPFLNFQFFSKDYLMNSLDTNNVDFTARTSCRLQYIRITSIVY